MINHILNIKNKKIRIFPFQSNDYAFLLYPDLQSSYLLTLLIDKIGFKLEQFSFTYVYLTQKYIDFFISNLDKWEEDYFVFYLENYFHSSNYAFGFLEIALDAISKLEKPPFIFIHSLKTPEDKIKKIIEKYDFVLVIVSGDFEEFFYDLFIEKRDINQIGNISYRNDNNEVFINKKVKIDSDLNKYIFPAYASKYYLHFLKSRDYILSFVDEDKKNINDDIYYNWSKEKFIKSVRKFPETYIMLASGRGCKYNCTYCYRGVKYSNIRQISLDTIRKDLEYLKEMQYEFIYFYDDCFITTNLDRLDEIVILLKEYDFEYGISARYEVATSENLLKLSKANIKRIQIGLQSISIEVNNNTKRGFNKQEFETTIQTMKQLNISLSLDIILGLPGEGLKGFLKTFNYALSLQPSSIFINSLFLNPGTDLYKNKDNYGIKTSKISSIERLFKVESIEYSNTFSKADIEVARKYVLYYVKKFKNISIILR